jgi:hypothetical protein
MMTIRKWENLKMENLKTFEFSNFVIFKSFNLPQVTHV